MEDLIIKVVLIVLGILLSALLGNFLSKTKELKEKIELITTEQNNTKSRLDLLEYGKVSREEMNALLTQLAEKIEKRIEEKQAIRDKRMEENYLYIKEKLDKIGER